MVQFVKVKKDNIVKEILEKDLPQYLAMGWKKVETATKINVPIYDKL